MRNPRAAGAASGAGIGSSSLSNRSHFRPAAPQIQEVSPRKGRGGRRSRDKGNRLERAIVKALQAHGLAAERVPLSGAARGRFGGDVSVPLFGVDRRIEVKARRNGFGGIYKALGDHDFLVIKRDRGEPLFVLRLKLGAEIAVVAELGRAGAR
jgi:Holliday junction resolvase